MVFNCRKCGKCCSSILRTVYELEYMTISSMTGDSFETVVEKLNSYPCGYLTSEGCSIHAFNPQVCYQYPTKYAEVCEAFKEASK
jgi:Fe-S-cluster containining protein